jgi:hypothetical protein
VTGLAAAPTDESPIVFLRRLLTQDKVEDALTFCAYLLPRREAVWWACASVKALLGDIPQSGASPWAAAETWVHEPTDQHRQAALDVALQSDSSDPVTWLAFAAGWSGGSLSTFPQSPVPVPPYMTARSARAAILLGTRGIAPAERPTRLRGCIETGIQLAERGL